MAAMLGSMRGLVSNFGNRLGSALSNFGSRTASALSTAADVGSGLGEAARSVSPLVAMVNPLAGAGLLAAGTGLSAGSDVVRKVSSSLLK